MTVTTREPAETRTSPEPAAEPMQVALLEALDLKAKLFKAFAEPVRLAILETLRDGEKTEGELAEAAGCHGLRLQNLLTCLQSMGLVAPTEEGGAARYALRDERIRAVLGLGDELLAMDTEGVYSCPRI